MPNAPRNEEVHLSFFKIKQCGYYKHGDKSPTLGNVNEALGQLQSWANGKPLGLTRLFDPPTDSDELPVYLLGIENYQNDWIVGMWNQTPHSEAGVPSVMINSQVGHAIVHMNGVVQNSIPGYATYFWIAPHENLLATLRFRHSVSGQTALRNYLHHFLSHESPYVVQAHGPVPAGQTPLIVGYTNRTDNEPMNVRPHFATEVLLRDGGDRAHVRQHVDRIKKVVRKGSVEVTAQHDRELTENVIRFFRRQSVGSFQVTARRKLRVELEYTPDLSEVNQMITAEDNAPERAWEDLGFVLQGEPSKVYWVGRSTVRQDADIPVIRSNDEVIDLEDFARQINTRRTTLLNFL